MRMPFYAPVLGLDLASRQTMNNLVNPLTANFERLPDGSHCFALLAHEQDKPVSLFVGRVPSTSWRLSFLGAYVRYFFRVYSLIFTALTPQLPCLFGQFPTSPTFGAIFLRQLFFVIHTSNYVISVTLSRETQRSV